MHEQTKLQFNKVKSACSPELDEALNDPRLLASSTWIVSYPRSGNTFMRALVANYLSGLDRPLSLQELHFSSYGEHVQEFWQELLGKPPLERSFEEEWGQREGYFAMLKAYLDGRTKVIKSHVPYIDVNGIPAFRLGADDRVIHVVRHPCDVAISSSHYYGVDMEEAIRRVNAENLLNHGHPANGYEFIGSWRQHTQSWMACNAAPVLRLRYFDMVQDTVATLTRVVEFMGYPVDPIRIELAVDFSRFGRLREQEQGSQFVENASATPFFRMGIPGKWTDTLTVDQARRVVNANADLMEQLGFMRLFVS